MKRREFLRYLVALAVSETVPIQITQEIIWEDIRLADEFRKNIKLGGIRNDKLYMTIRTDDLWNYVQAIDQHGRIWTTENQGKVWKSDLMEIVLEEN
jgi:hypothetical protein